MTKDQFLRNLFTKFNGRITDKVFLFIQEDRDLMQGYLGLLRSEAPDNLNQEIGKAIKEQYTLENCEGPEDRENDPRSTLIKSHQRFKAKS